MDLNAGKINTTGCLRRETGPECGKLHLLSGSEILIGRNQNAAIKIFSASVSRNHCLLRHDKGVWNIIDNKSSNGLWIDLKKLKPNLKYPLKHGQKIYFGPPENCAEAETHSFTYFDVNSTGNSDKNVLPLHDNKSRKNEIKSSHNIQTCIETSTPKKNDSENIILEKVTKKRKPEDEASCSKFNPDIDLLDSPIKSVKRQKSNVSDMENKILSIIHEPLSFPSLSSPVISSPSLKERLEMMKHRLEESDKIHKKVQQTLRNSEACLSENRQRNLNKHFECQETAKANTSKEDEVEETDSQSLLTKFDEYYLDSEPYPFSQPLIDDIRYPIQDSTSSNSPTKSPTKVELCDQENKVVPPVPSKDESEKNDALRQELEKALLEKKELLEKHDIIKKEEEKLRNELETAKNCQLSTKSEVISQFGEIMEVEFTCGICTELFIRAITLDCSHTFCERCILEWKKKKKQCPICRAKINGETRALVIDNFIEKMVCKLSTEYQERRKTVVEDRLKETSVPKPPQQSRRGRGGGRRNQRNPAPVPTPSTSNVTIDSNVYVPIENLDILDTDIEIVAAFSELDYNYDDETSTESNSESESSVEGDRYAYYGGYGRCFNCGRRGHWANGCPDP